MIGDDEFREQFRRMRETHSVGVILSLLAEFVAGDFVAEDQTRIVLGTLYTMTVGVDAVRYRPTREA